MESFSISYKCPNNPKPVISVIAFALLSSEKFKDFLFSSVIMSVTVFMLSSEAIPLLIAVVIIPVPIGFVKKSLSPSLISLFLNILSFITPVIEKPYFGSLSSIL